MAKKWSDARRVQATAGDVQYSTSYKEARKRNTADGRLSAISNYSDVPVR